MRPSNRARIAAAITLSKGKMYEYGVPEADHLQLPAEFDLEQQFPFAIGTLGDFAAESVKAALELPPDHAPTTREEVIFSAQVLQAYDDSKLNSELSFELRLMAAAAFYLGDVPGTSTVQIQRLITLAAPTTDPLAIAVRVALDRPWAKVGVQVTSPAVVSVLVALREHFQSGGGEAALGAISTLRRWAYRVGTAHELLLADILGAVVTKRMSNSSWSLLPAYTGLSQDVWRAYLSRPKAIKEMWPSQRMLGEAGLYRGESGVVQMPTSAGKTRATQLVLRAAFLSGRTRLAVVVTPFRALCQEVAFDLRLAFSDDGYRVNQFSDALQVDFAEELMESLVGGLGTSPHVVVLTPEKLLYVLRREPAFIEKLGLIVYDEGHQFDTGPRGVVYELLLTSIKRLLSDGAQTVLISAVIENADEVARWLLGDSSNVIRNQWLQSRRLVAFASLPPGMGGQLRFNVDGGLEQEFYVPRVMVGERLRRRAGESKPRVFPTTESGSVALYLGLRLVQNGGVAIYARTKVSAAKIVREAATEVFARGVSLASPADSGDAGEIQRLTRLFEENFGPESYLTKAAGLGIFAHHGNTPHGLRLAIEHAMREDLIRLIVCTSTLAQGVNLPIRYLLVTSPMQGREAIRPRDFHNLMGRAGRAGMHGEGTVIFTDHRLYDGRGEDAERWAAALELLLPGSAKEAGSTLLGLLEPMWNDRGTRQYGEMTPVEVVTNLIEDREGLFQKIRELSPRAKRSGFSTESLRKQLEAKQKTIEAVESFLMTYRESADVDSVVASARALARETLAYSLANLQQRDSLEDVFERVATRIETLVPDATTQARYGRTLLGLNTVMAVDKWVALNLFELSLVESDNDLFDVVWPLLRELSTSKRLSDTEPAQAIEELARGWLKGRTFKKLFDELESLQANFPYGDKRRKFSIDAAVGLCEHTFGFEFALLLSAVRDSFKAFAFTERGGEEFAAFADILQKRLKYGLPTQDSVAYFEAGFSERVVAQKIAEEVFWDVASSPYGARSLVRENVEELRLVVRTLPDYFQTVFADIVG